MQTSRIAIDGLWQCLCPLFDAGLLTKAPSAARRAQFRPHLIPGASKMRRQLTTTASAIQTQKRSSQYEAPLPRRQHVSLSSTDVLRNAINGSSTSSGEPHYSDLANVPIPKLHDLLRQHRTRQGSYKMVKDLVNYLVTIREQKMTLLYYDALIRINADADHGSAAEVSTIIRDMKEAGIRPDSGVYNSILQVLANHPDYVLRASILQEMKDSWVTLIPDGWHNIAIGLLRERQYELALDKLWQMQQEGIRVQPWLYDIFIYVLCEAEELDEALRLLQQREHQGDTDISANVWYYMLDACSSSYHYDGTLYIWQRRVTTSFLHPSDGMLTNILNLAGRFQDPNLATDVVRIMAARSSKSDVHHYEALLTSYASPEGLETAFKVLCIMKKAKFEPKEEATRPIFDYLTQNAQDRKHTPQEALDILRQLHTDGQVIPTAAVNVVISAATFTTSLTTAITLYKQLHTICSDGPNTATFNILFQGCVNNRPDSELLNSSTDIALTSAKAQAMFLASEMVVLGVKADVLTYDQLIVVCLKDTTKFSPDVQDENFEDALKYLDELRRTRGVLVPSSLTMTNSAGLDDTSAKANKTKGAPLSPSTWELLVRASASRGDERVWALLTEMELLGHDIGSLKMGVEGIWRRRREGLERRAKQGEDVGNISSLGLGARGEELINPADL